MKLTGGEGGVGDDLGADAEGEHVGAVLHGSPLQVDELLGLNGGRNRLRQLSLTSASITLQTSRVQSTQTGKSCDSGRKREEGEEGGRLD